MIEKLVLTGTALAFLLAAPGASVAQTDKDKFDKAGQKTENALDKAGSGAEEGLEATGDGVGAAVEHTGRAVTKAGKATAGAMKHTGEAIADFFDDDDDLDMDGQVKTFRKAQKKLKKAGYYNGPVDGIAGPQTRDAIIEYQRKEGLTVTGRLDSDTRIRLDLD